jgi:hypothetical protein
MGAEEQIGRARHAIVNAAELLRAPSFNGISDLAVELETAIGELEAAARAGIGSDSAGEVLSLCAEVRLLTALHSNAEQFYRGWARLAAAIPTGYTATGAEAGAATSESSLSAQA